MSLFELIRRSLPCLQHQGELDVIPGCIRLKCRRCGKVTEGLSLPTLDEWEFAQAVQRRQETRDASISKAYV